MNATRKGDKETMNTKLFILAGNATFTVSNPKTERRFTYKIRAKEVENDKVLHFVSVLTGSDNEADFSFLGTIFDGNTFRHSHKSRIGRDALSAKAFSWIFPRIVSESDLHGVEIHHEGRCGRCGRKLTVPESVDSGFGPECINMVRLSA